MNPQQLPALTIGPKRFFIDRRLRQLRNVANPFETIDFRDEAEMETFLHRHPGVLPNTHTTD